MRACANQPFIERSALDSYAESRCADVAGIRRTGDMRAWLDCILAQCIDVQVPDSCLTSQECEIVWLALGRVFGCQPTV